MDQKETRRSPLSWVVAGAICGSLLLTGAAQAEVIIYQHTFGDASGSLGGTAVEVATGTAGGTAGAAWAPTAYWQADGSVEAVTFPPGTPASEQNTYSDAGVLPFTPQAGWTYTLSLTDVTHNGSNWLWLGFGDGTLAGTGTDARPQAGALGWVAAPLGQTFPGPQTSVGGQTFTAPSGPFDIDIVLDAQTDPDNWTFEWFVNGESIRKVALNGGTSVVYTPEAGDPVVYEINQVAFGRYRNAGGQIGTFSLTAVPEPASMLLVGAGAGLLLLRRRTS